MPRRQTVITGKLLNDLWNVGAKHALYREDGKWYHHLDDFPGVLFDSNGYIVFHTEKDYQENPDLQLKKDLHIIGGISSLPGYIRVSERNQFQAFSQNLQQTIEKAPFYPDKSLERDLPKVADLPEKLYEAARKSTTIQRIIRDTEIARRVKQIHNFRCQICGYTLDFGNGKLYAEAHHIRPLGSEHNGPDIVENIMCVCPNHHALLDYRAIPINLTDLRKTSGHILSELYIDYHNTSIFNQGTIASIHR